MLAANNPKVGDQVQVGRFRGKIVQVYYYREQLINKPESKWQTPINCPLLEVELNVNQYYPPAGQSSYRINHTKVQKARQQNNGYLKTRLFCDEVNYLT